MNVSAETASQKRSWIGLPIATFIDIRGIIASPLARLMYFPSFASDRKGVDICSRCELC
jgi:hypothetical protein